MGNVHVCFNVSVANQRRQSTHTRSHMHTYKHTYKCTHIYTLAHIHAAVRMHTSAHTDALMHTYMQPYANFRVLIASNEMIIFGMDLCSSVRNWFREDVELQLTLRPT